MSRLPALLILIPLGALLGCHADSPAAPGDEVPALTAELPDAASAHAQSAGSNGLVRSTWPSAEDPGMPFYTRVEPSPPHVYSDGEWAVIPFYRDPDCVPGGFNLLNFFDPPAAFGCAPTVSGHSLWHGAVGNGAPKHVVSRGMGSVPVWFVPQTAMVDALSDGVLTIGEIEGLPGLVKGSAGTFDEVLHPHPLPPMLGGGGHPVPKTLLNARGTLEDGRSFAVNLTRVNDGTPNVRIWIR